MAEPKPIDINFGILHQDVTKLLVDDQLRRQRATDLFYRVSLQDWNLLEQTHPNLAHYISVTSYETAPNDPEQRERVAANLLGLYALLDEAAIHREVATLWTASGLDLPVQRIVTGDPTPDAAVN